MLDDESVRLSVLLIKPAEMKICANIIVICAQDLDRRPWEGAWSRSQLIE